MNSRLNYSSLEDAWGIKNSTNESDQITLEKQFNQNPEIKYNTKYKKPVENILTIGSNEVVKPIVESYHPVKTPKGSIIKPCSLVEDHISKCELCRNKLTHHVDKYDNNQNSLEHFSETFENVTPNQKNLLVIILYGILVILISDLIIKERDD